MLLVAYRVIDGTADTKRLVYPPLSVAPDKDEAGKMKMKLSVAATESFPRLWVAYSTLFGVK